MLHRSMPRVLTSVFSAPRVAKPAGRASSSFGLLFQPSGCPFAGERERLALLIHESNK